MKATILGISGHVGHEIAKAFVAGGWDVTGFSRTNKQPIPGVRFARGHAENIEDIRAAIGDSEVVVNALNLPYHQWDKGRMEALYARVVEAMGTDGKTMLFPGNVYNFAATDRVLTPDLAQHPETPRGAIRVRSEALLKAATANGGLQVLVLRAGDFFGPESSNDWFDNVMLREAGKGKLAMPGETGVGHAWAYLPDLARAFEILARRRSELGAFETFHFESHFVTPERMATAIVKAAPAPLKVSRVSWLFLSLIGTVSPLLREVVKMNYLWHNPMRLEDRRLRAILGHNFDTPFEEAVAASIARYFPAMRQAA